MCVCFITMFGTKQKIPCKGETLMNNAPLQTFNKFFKFHLQKSTHLKQLRYLFDVFSTFKISNKTLHSHHQKIHSPFLYSIKIFRSSFHIIIKFYYAAQLCNIVFNSYTRITFHLNKLNNGF